MASAEDYSRIRSGAGRKGGIWTSRKLGQAGVILKIWLRKCPWKRRKVEVMKTGLVQKLCKNRVTFTHKGGPRCLKLAIEKNIVGDNPERWVRKAIF